MNYEKVIKSLIKKALNKNWSWPFDIESQHHFLSWCGSYENSSYAKTIVDGVILQHNFVKAIFGDYEDVKYISNDPAKTKIYEWQLHLQRMVLENDPVKYLEKFL